MAVAAAGFSEVADGAFVFPALECEGARWRGQPIGASIKKSWLARSV